MKPGPGIVRRKTVLANSQTILHVVHEHVPTVLYYFIVVLNIQHE